MMLSCHPYNNWPLHVKLFTDEAVKAWNDAAKSPSASKLPTGLTLTVEIEGVDGKSGQMGSGRRGPIDVTDGIQFSVTKRIIFDISEKKNLLPSISPRIQVFWLALPSYIVQSVRRTSQVMPLYVSLNSI
jgi:hypothetical protein